MLSFRYFDAESGRRLGLNKDPKYVTVPDSERIELFDSTNDSEVLGYVEIVLLRQPFEFYYVGWLITRVPRKDLKIGELSHGEMVLEQANKFIASKDLPGILCNSIPASAKVHGIYLKHDWQAIAPRIRPRKMVKL